MFLIVLRLWFRPLLADEDEWAGIELAGRSVLSANDLHEHFTEDDGSAPASYARLLVLCACMSGKPERETGQSLGCKACDCNLLTDAFALVRTIFIPRPLRARGCQKGGRAGLCSSGAAKWHVPVRESITLINRVYTFMATHKVRRRSAVYVSQMS